MSQKNINEIIFKNSQKIGFFFLTTALLTLGISSKAYSQSTTPGLCMRHTRISGSSGNVIDTNWICSSFGDYSKWIGLGDDTGWKDQELSFRTNGNITVCLAHSRVSPTSGVLKDNECSHSDDAKTIYLGDDTGWKDQKLNFSIHSPKNNYEICLQHRRKSGSTGNKIDTGWKCNGKNSTNTIYLGDDTGWRNQLLRFKIRRI